MDFAELVRSHRSIRRYRPDPVAPEALERILEAGLRASSSGNMQAFSVIVTTDESLRRRLWKAHWEQDMVLEAPCVVTFCADFRRMRRWLKLSDAADNFDNPMSFLIGALDAALVAQNAALAAENEGLGICFMGTTLANCREIGQLLQVPPGVVPVCGFVLGHPAEDPPRRDRLPLAGLVHRETYQDREDAAVKEIYAARETAGWARYMAHPELRERVEAAGVKNLAQLYTTVKYTRESHEEYSRAVLACLREQDFLHSTDAM